MRSGPSLLGVVAVAALAMPACNTVPGEKFQNVQRELQLAQEKIQQLERQVLDQQQTIRSQQEQVATLRGVKTSDIDQLVIPDKIELERLSGAYDNDGKPGDDGIVLYVQPVDRDGSVIKAAGTIDVKLVDLANPPDDMVIATYHFDPPTTRSLWYGRLMTNHFTVRCPWPPNRLPEHPDITAQVTFTELLTGRVLQAQGVFKVKLPGATSPATAAAAF